MSNLSSRLPAIAPPFSCSATCRSNQERVRAMRHKILCSYMPPATTGTAPTWSSMSCYCNRANVLTSFWVNQNCSLRNNTKVTSKHRDFNYLHNALEEGVEELDAMREGKYALIERSEYNSNQYRIAFEDQNHFGDEQFADIKKNGYGNQHWRNTGTKHNPNWTYGGTGWNVDPAPSNE